MDGSQSELDEIAPLPRGRHGLSSAQVADHQRERILAAVATVVAEHGYWSLTVEQVIDLAGVSRSTFYVHFQNKQEAALAAHERVFQRLLAELSAACVAEDDWPMKVNAALGATIDFATARPRQTQMLSTGSLHADSILAARVANSHDQLAVLLSGLRPKSPHAAELPDATERFLIAAIASVLAARLLRGGEADLDSLRGELVELTLIPYLGASEAARIAGSAR
jgi:AcrR family transcriptional regulator